MITNKQTFYTVFGDGTGNFNNFVLCYGERYGDKWMRDFLLTDEGVAYMQDLLKAHTLDDSFGMMYNHLYVEKYAEFLDYMERKERAIWERINNTDCSA